MKKLIVYLADDSQTAFNDAEPSPNYPIGGTHATDLSVYKDDQLIAFFPEGRWNYFRIDEMPDTILFEKAKSA